MNFVNAQETNVPSIRIMDWFALVMVLASVKEELMEKSCHKPVPVTRDGQVDKDLFEDCPVYASK